MRYALARALLIWLALTVAVWAQPETIEEAGQTNLFLDEDDAQVHVLIRPQQRLIFAFPSENSGHGVWFDGRLSAQPQSLESLPDERGGQRVRLRVSVETSTTVQRVLLDSLRVLRDQGEGDGRLAGQVEKARLHHRSGDAFLKIRQSGPAVCFERSQGVLSPPSQFELILSPAHLHQDGKVTLEPGEVTVEVRLPFPALGRFSPQELYHPDFLKHSPSTPRGDRALRALEFLTRREKMMAGSWRFLTYFGRDTLISVAMLEPILSDEALTTAIESVLNRLSPEGAVAHEEDIGPFAEWRRLTDSGRASLEPVYDHKMVDDDLLLVLLLAKLESAGRTELVQRLLSEPKTRTLLLRNADYARTMLAQPNMIRLLPGEATGDWRDSHEGLGDGVYPASINSGLALATVWALHRLEDHLPTPRPEVVEELTRLEAVWKERSQSFWIELSPEQVRTRLHAFSESLSPERREGLQKLISERTDLLEQPVRYPVLSFDEKMRPVEVMHSDVAFTLFYGHPSRRELQDILTLLERPFPFGLQSDAGYLVANPIFSSDPKHYQSLGLGQYHGLVVWSWPQAMLSLGLMGQQGRFTPEEDRRIARLLQTIRQGEERVGALATSELLAIDLDPSGLTWRAYGVAGDQTESNALQLWSTIYPALEYARAKATARTAP